MSIRAGCHILIKATLLHRNVQWQATHTNSFVKVSANTKDKTTARPSLLHCAETLSPAPSICVSWELPSAGTVFYPMPVPGWRTFHAVQPQACMLQGNPPAAGTKATGCAVMLRSPPCFLPAPRSPTITPPKPECKLRRGEQGRRRGEGRGCPVTQREITARFT